MRKLTKAAIAAAGLATLAPAAAAHAAPAPAPTLFPERWIDGTNGAEPAVQVQALDADTFVLRQSVHSNFEAPFLYLLFGRDKALLVDSGAEGARIVPTVDALIAAWSARHGGKVPPLIVAHSHSHGDHVATDAAFRARPGTTVVGLKPADVAAFFGVRDWPRDIASFDLGGRRLSIIPTPGHQAAAIMVYDPRLKILLSGDTLYPGRLYVPVNFLADDRASLDRLAAFARSHPIRAALGAHIEMTTSPGKDYGHEAPAHPDEHRLELPPTQIAELRAGLRALLDAPDIRQVHDHFIIVTVPPRAE
ncbi:MBL fold metallo-hydrolase [Novosphingobium huizhouense]|uniref:MBL fold metallo-hydrolase n=1 Tax=Novosphingobium huizhouense TaxID=2866625 RepID=UPI001CD90F5E|nr:MBL fold metallo-hydrolase [Novosphingobium huizhouense]